MLSSLALRSLLAIALSGAIGQTSPLDNARNLVSRDIISDYKCSNAPAISGGIDEVINTDLPPSGSWEVHKKYLWCTPGSTTYTFFAFTDVNTTTGTAPHYVNYYRTFNQMATRLNEWNIRTPGNDPSRWLIDLAFDELNTNVRIYMKSNVGKMQYDTAQAAMTDLALAIQDSNTANVPVVFTIYDGRFGEVGTGYAGEVGAGGVQCAEDSTVASLICKEILKDGPHGGDVPVLNTEGTSLVAGISGA